MPASAAPGDEDLMLAYAAGDAAAFDTLYARHKGGVYRYLLRQCRQGGVADELFQDVWMNLIRARLSYVPSAKFTTWLYRLVTNICLDGLRRRGRAVDSLDEPSSAQSGDDAQTAGERLADNDRWSQPEQEVTLRESASEVRAALQELPPAQRLALTLHYFDDLRYEDIAETMGLPLNTVKSHIRRGKERLALMLTNPAEEQPCSA